MSSCTYYIGDVFIDERNADLARDRIGMFLDVIDTREKGAA